MIAFFLLLVIVAIALGIIGVVAKGLLYLLIIGIVVFLGALIFAALRMRRRPGRRPAVGPERLGVRRPSPQARPGHGREQLMFDLLVPPSDGEVGVPSIPDV